MKQIKIRLPSKRKEERTIRFSIAFKTSVLYTLLFGVALAVAVGVLTWGLAARTARIQRLNRASTQLMARVALGPRGGFDFDTFARANNLYIEISREGGGLPEHYGDRPQPGVRYDEIRRHAGEGTPGHGAFLRIVDLETISPIESMTIPEFLLAFVGLLALVAVAGAFLMRRMMRPVYDMTHTARSISATDLSRRIEPVRSHDELSELAGTFNEMLDRIQTAYEQQKRFVSDASHELRTPLSVISGYANLLRRWGGEDRAVRSEAVDKIIEESGNMQHLVENLLFLARADGQTQTFHPELFCAGDMMHEVAQETKLIDREHSITEEIEPDVMLTADPALMKQAVRAVVENSCKYTPAGGTVKLSCRKEGGVVLLAVEDNGAGIAEKDLPHIFDRFYKADTARTRGTRSSSGLGLSIVKWIIERSGGTIVVRSSRGEGTCVTFHFPPE
jgi:two-component system sensor histidine kinase ArlS